MQSVLDKIKRFWEGVKEAIVYVFGPLAFIVGVLYYLATRKIPGVKQEEEKFDGDHAETIKIEGQADQAASDSLDAYARCKDDYLKGRPKP